MITFTFHTNTFQKHFFKITACQCEGHDSNDRIRVTKGLVLPAPLSTMVESKKVSSEGSPFYSVAVDASQLTIIDYNKQSTEMNI